MTKPNRIVEVKLDSQSLGPGSTEIEIERHKTISDLLDENSFKLAEPASAEGPYKLHLRLTEDRLHMQVGCKDYSIVCDNFYKTAKAGEMHRLEAIDAGRRSIHDEAAELLAETLENKVILDKPTARRLFTLLYVLHIRNNPTLT